MTKHQPDLPDLPDKIGTRGRTRLPDGTITYFTILDEVKHPLTQDPVMALYLQKIRHDHTGMEELRFGYYIIGKTGRMTGKWVWGQYAPMFPAQDFTEIYRLGHAKGWY